MKKKTVEKTFKAYMLRTCAKDMTAHGGFKWPKSGEVKAPDWDTRNECGNGLHGLLWGEGDGTLLNWSDDAKWMVCGIDQWVELDGKVKAPKATVIYCGTRDEAAALISHLGGGKYAVVGGTATAGYRGTATAGYRGTATAGYRGTATAGDGGTATAGESGTATAGDSGTATAGDSGTATAGYRGTATAGYRGTVMVKWWDGSRYRISIGYCNENGIKPNVKYKCDDNGNLIEA